MPLNAQVDHLVVIAKSLDQGVRWCEDTLGISPGPGGQHPLMGTHNRLFKIASAQYPQAYFEIIAIDPLAPQPNRRRWFDMDEASQQELVNDSPQLLHFVARVARISDSVAAWHELEIDRGAIVQASRPTSGGLLQWQISVRDDGQRLFDGGLPTLIEWGQTHPTTAMPEMGIELRALQINHPQAPVLSAAFKAIGLHGVRVQSGPAQLIASLSTPRGEIEIRSALR
jgi:hypothetical protein